MKTLQERITEFTQLKKNKEAELEEHAAKFLALAGHFVKRVETPDHGGCDCIRFQFATCDADCEIHMRSWEPYTLVLYYPGMGHTKSENIDLDTFLDQIATMIVAETALQK